METWKDKTTNEKQEKTEWHNITVFGKLAEICQQYLHKGSQVFIEGRIQTDKYTDKAGVEKYSTKIICNTMKMLGSKSDSGEEQTAARPKPAAAEQGKPDFNDDIWLVSEPVPQGTTGKASAAASAHGSRIRIIARRQYSFALAAARLILETLEVQRMWNVIKSAIRRGALKMGRSNIWMVWLKAEEVQMIREYRYMVFKLKDTRKALTQDERGILKHLLGKVHDYRIGEGKAPLECVVVESDWPEYEPTWNSIEERIKNVNARFNG